MEAGKELRSIPGMTDVFTQLDQEWDKVDVKAGPEKKDSVYSFFTEAFEELRTVIDGNIEETSGDSEIENLKDQANNGFADAKKDIEKASATYRETRTISESDISKILNDYARGYEAFVELCHGGATSSLVERWNQANMGSEVSCPQLVTSQSDVEKLAKVGFSPDSSGSASSTDFSFSQWLKDRGRYGFGPMGFYERNPLRHYGGVGLFGEALFSVKPNSPWVVGGAIKASVKNGYDGDKESPFQGELKTTEWNATFPLLEGGYLTPNWGVLLVGGGWFTNASIPETEQPYTPYSSNPLENGNYLVGLKGSALKNHLGLEVAYTQSPWGPGFKTELVFNSNFWR